MLYDNNSEPCEIYFKDWLNFLDHPILKYKFTDAYSYIFQPDMGKWIESKMKPPMVKSLRDVLRIYWNKPNFSKSLLRFDCFWIAKDKLDEDGNIVLVFDPIYLKDYELS
jgi:hypothetical protein